MVRSGPQSRAVALPAVEQALYWIFGIACTFYGIFRVYVLSREAESQVSPELGQLQDGRWPFLGGKQDAADTEWHLHSANLLWRVLPWCAAHSALSLSLQFLDIKGTARKLLFISCGAASAHWMLSWRYLVLTVSTILLFRLVSTRRSVPEVWLAGILLVQALNSGLERVMYHLGIHEQETLFVFVIQFAALVTRGIAFGLERVWSLNRLEGESPAAKSSDQAPHQSLAHCVPDVQPDAPSSDGTSNGKDGKIRAPPSDLYGWPVLPKVPGIIDGLCYALYSPVFLGGMQVDFYTFHTQTESPIALTSVRALHIVRCLLRVAFWSVFNEVALHFLFFTSLARSPTHLMQMDQWTLLGAVFLMSQFTTNKYFVFLGFPTQFTRLDGLETPAFPVCISTIYRYSDGYRSFDRNIYEYLKRYIYVPCGGSRSGFVRHQMATLLTFTFMGFFHGGRMKHAWWVVICIVEVEMEILGAWLEKSQFVQTHLLQKLSPHGDARLRGALWALTLMVGVTSSLIFTEGTDFAKNFAYALFIPAGPLALAQYAVFYCVVQNARHLERLGYCKY